MIQESLPVVNPEFDPNNIEIRAWIFDWDDTGQNTGRPWIEAHREVLAGYGFDESETSDEIILSKFGNIRVALDFGVDAFRKPTDVNEDGSAFSDDQVAYRVFDEIEAVVTQKLSDVRMDPNLVAAIRGLRDRGERVSVFSSSPRALLNRSIELNGLTDVFDIIISKDDVDPDKTKPHPQGIERCIAAMNEHLLPNQAPIQPNQVMMVGDSWNDVKAGKAAGTHTLKLSHPLHQALQRNKFSKEYADVEATGDSVALEALAESHRPTLELRSYPLIDFQDATMIKYDQTRNNLTILTEGAESTARRTSVDELVELIENPKILYTSIRNRYQESQRIKAEGKDLAGLEVNQAGNKTTVAQLDSIFEAFAIAEKLVGLRNAAREQAERDAATKK